MRNKLKNNGGSLVVAPVESQAGQSVKSIITGQMRCGDCSRLEDEKLNEHFCNESGRLPASKACTSFTPNFFPVAKNDMEMDALDQFAGAIQGMSVKTLRVIAGILLREPVTRKHGYHFMEKVYVRYQGGTSDNFLSNFCVCYVIDATKDRIRLVGASNRVIVTLYRPTLSIYSEHAFSAMRKEMRMNNRLFDPAIAKFARNFDLRRQIIGLDDLVETRFLDDAMEIFGVGSGEPEAAVKRSRPSLESFARTVETGHIMRRRKNVIDQGDNIVLDRGN